MVVTWWCCVVVGIDGRMDEDTIQRLDGDEGLNWDGGVQIYRKVGCLDTVISAHVWVSDIVI